MLSFLDPVMAKVRAGLAIAMPRRLFLPGLPWERPEEILVASLPLAPDALESIRAAGRAGRRLTIKLSMELGFQRSVLMPARATSAASGVVDLHLRETLPNKGAGLVWRTIGTRRRDDSAEVQVAVFSHDLVETILRTARTADAMVESVVIDGAEDHPLYTTPASNHRRVMIGIGASVGIIVSAAVLQIVTLESATQRIEARREALSVDLATAQTALDAFMRSNVDNPRSGDGLAKDVDLFASGTGTLGKLAGLTERLPDDVWISELSAETSTIRLSGFTSTNVADIVTALSGLPWIADVEIAGPAVVDPQTQQTRFDLDLLLQHAT